MVLRFLRRLVGALLIIVVLASAALWLGLRASLPHTDGTLELAGLEQPVRVTRDAAGVPTVEATSRLDLARATGYVHAQERFFQMDLMRRDAAGEISALFGSVAVQHDARRRLHGLRSVAERSLALMPPARRAQLDAYVQGVNAGLDALGARPPEYLLLRQQPEPWSPVDTLLVVHAMWLTLTDETGERDLALTRIHARLPAAMARFLARPGTHLDAALDGSTTVAPRIPTADEFDLRVLLAGASPPAPGVLPEAPVLGSNAFAVGSSRSGGGALLANDMHLGLRVPNIWYRARLRLTGANGLDLIGVTLPGTPAVVVGSNGQVAWGFTNAYVDVTDRVRVTPVPGDPARYRTADGDRPFTARTERIAVAGGIPVERTFRDTVWGPVVEADRELHALRWAGHAPAATNLELMQFEHAGSVDDALALAGRVGIPAQNLLLADSAGHIAWTVVGRLPARLADVGQTPADQDRALEGRDLPASDFAWTERSAIPVIRDPGDGVLWTANARPVGGASLAVLGNGNYAVGARAAQIRDALHEHERHDESSLLAIALDDRALYMARWKVLLDATLERSASRIERGVELAGVLETWSGRALPDDAAYRWVREFRDTVRFAILSTLAEPMKLPPEAVPFRGIRQDEAVVWQVLDARPPNLLHPTWADWDTMLTDAVARTIARVTERHPGPLGARTWGERNLVPVAHPLSRAVPSLGALLDMPEHASPGDAWVPRVLRDTQGASERLILRVGDEANGIFHMPGGQSGHLLSPWYRYGFEDWVQGRASPLLPGEATAHLALMPARSSRPATSQ